MSEESCESLYVEEFFGSSKDGFSSIPSLPKSLEGVVNKSSRKRQSEDDKYLEEEPYEKVSEDESDCSSLKAQKSNKVATGKVKVSIGSFNFK